MGPGLLDALSQIEDPGKPKGAQAVSQSGDAGLVSVRHSLPPAAGAAVEVLILYRVIKSAPLTVREAHLVRLIQRALRTESPPEEIGMGR